MYSRPDGRHFDKNICIAAKPACRLPYDAIFINPEDILRKNATSARSGSTSALSPPAVVCPTERFSWERERSLSRVAQIVTASGHGAPSRERDAAQALLQRGARGDARPPRRPAPPGGLFMWSEQQHGRNGRLRQPRYANLRPPRCFHTTCGTRSVDWRVALHVDQGDRRRAYLARCCGRFRLPDAADPLWLWSLRRVGRLLAITGAAGWTSITSAFPVVLRGLRAKLARQGGLHHRRVFLILALHFTASLVGSTAAQRALAWPGLPLAVLTAVYTAYLFAQAKARDMWQNPLLPPHLLVQSLLVGAAALLPFAAWLAPGAVTPLLWTLSATSILHLLMIWGEVTLTHPTAHARLAVWR